MVETKSAASRRESCVPVSNQAIPRLIEGTLIADVIAALGSMDFVLGDTDR